MMFMLPAIQLGVLPLAMNFDVKRINLAIVNNDYSPVSYKLVNKINSSGYFKIIAAPASYKEAMIFLDKGAADIILQIPANFERDLVRNNENQLFVGSDAINGTKSGLGTAYLNTVIMDFNRELIEKNVVLKSNQGLNVTSTTHYNPYASYFMFIVPGILVMLVTIIAGFLSALNIVREKEAGTIEQINVTPIKKWQFLVGKLIPFWVVGMVVFSVGVIVMRFIYRIEIEASLLLLYSVASLYVIAMLGFGLFISTISHTQVQSMFIAFFFIMPFVLMSGLFTSVESMPAWARQFSNALPITHFIKVVRLVVLKGSGFAQIQKEILYILGFAVALNAFAIWNYRKTS